MYLPHCLLHTHAPALAPRPVMTAACISALALAALLVHIMTALINDATAAGTLSPFFLATALLLSVLLVRKARHNSVCVHQQQGEARGEVGQESTGERAYTREKTGRDTTVRVGR